MSRSERLLERGVHTMPFRTRDGRQVAVAIDRHGRCVDWIMFDAADRQKAHDRMSTSLKWQDGEPTLRVVG